MARIVVMFGTKAERIIELDTNELIVGRGSDVHLDLEHDLVSRRHCQIRLVGDGHVVEDLRSTSGTYVNKERASAHILEDGDQVGIGPWSLVYEKPFVGAPEEQQEKELGAFWADAAADSGVMNTTEEAAKADLALDQVNAPLVSASSLGPEPAGQSMDDYTGTMLASADEMARIRESLEASQQPHLTVRAAGRVEKLKLEDTTFEVGFFDDADYRLPGRRWLGKSQFILRELDPGTWQVERGSFWAKVKVGGKPLQGARALRDGSVIAAAGLKFRFKKGS
jgi:hypothetical protein